MPFLNIIHLLTLAYVLGLNGNTPDYNLIVLINMGEFEQTNIIIYTLPTHIVLLFFTPLNNVPELVDSFALSFLRCRVSTAVKSPFEGKKRVKCFESPQGEYFKFHHSLYFLATTPNLHPFCIEQGAKIYLGFIECKRDVYRVGHKWLYKVYMGLQSNV